jgi:hypothetical protein
MAKKKEKPTKNYSQNTTHKTKGWAIYASDGWTVPAPLMASVVQCLPRQHIN